MFKTRKLYFAQALNEESTSASDWTRISRSAVDSHKFARYRVWKNLFEAFQARKNSLDIVHMFMVWVVGQNFGIPILQEMRQGGSVRALEPPPG